jgi:hypothetical protein
MSSPFEEMSSELQDFWIGQQKRGNVRKTPRSGSCMLCAKKLTDTDDDHSVCNICWVKLGDDSEV